MMGWLPDSTDFYWAVVCAALAVLNVWQFARTRDLSGTLGLLFKHGHAPEGKALVPADSVKASLNVPTQFPTRGIQPAVKRRPWKE